MKNISLREVTLVMVLQEVIDNWWIPIRFWRLPMQRNSVICDFNYFRHTRFRWNFCNVSGK